MPRPRNHGIPRLSHHKGRELGYVRISGHPAHYLSGKWPKGEAEPPASVRREYDKFIAEWLQGGRWRRSINPPRHDENVEELASAISVSELCERYFLHALQYYRDRDGQLTGETESIKYAFRALVYLFGDLPAIEFSPKKLRAVQELLVRGYAHPDHGHHEGITRAGVNSRTARIKRLFKWATGEELVPPAVFHGLTAVSGLPRGRTAARENPPVMPVEDAEVEKTLPHLRPTVAGMVRLQFHSAMRPGEVCKLTLSELDRSGEVWVYTPRRHKTAYLLRRRKVFLGPKAQAVLREFIRVRCWCCGWEGRRGRLDCDHRDNPAAIREAHDADEPLFSPRRDREEWFVDRRATRVTKVQPSQRNRRKRRPARVPGASYCPRAYNRAVARACQAAGIKAWNVNQLRHSQATRIRRQFGLEAAQVILGHSRADVTQIYAERDEGLASRIAREVG